MKYQSPNFNGKIFLNPVPTQVMGGGSFFRMMRESLQDHPNRNPGKPLGPFSVGPEFHAAPGQLKATWLGHATAMLEVDGIRLLTDPVWYQRASPFTRMGPKRYFEVPVALEDLPRPDVILLSHDHYDHLDKKTMLFLADRKIPIITMLGVGARLRQWGVAAHQVTELDWWQEIRFAGLSITACPARHFSGRWVNDRFTTLWGAFSIKGPQHSVFYGADSGYFPGFREIGNKLGPFDLTLLEIGAYFHLWQDIHMGPENAVQAHMDLNGKILLPIHWGTFSLSFHPWTEPVERLIAAAEPAKVSLLLPAPGQTCNLEKEMTRNYWWR